VCSRTMRLSTFCGLSRDQEQVGTISWYYKSSYCACIFKLKTLSPIGRHKSVPHCRHTYSIESSNLSLVVSGSSFFSVRWRCHKNIFLTKLLQEILFSRYFRGVCTILLQLYTYNKKECTQAHSQLVN
jgi:hypothetical protein